jgi:predicted regulator of Ras-like GTPase activity (Roadblock/LC7/MglB family)
MDAAQALADLTEISSQIDAAVLAEADGSVVASTFREAAGGDELARAAVELVSAAGDARGAESAAGSLVQIQAATPHGSVFVVRDDRHVVAAITGSKPTVGLVFYDLKTCLRMLEQEEEEADKPATAVKAAAAAAAAAAEPASSQAKVGKASATRKRAPAKKKTEEAGDA